MDNWDRRHESMNSLRRTRSYSDLCMSSGFPSKKLVRNKSYIDIGMSIRSRERCLTVADKSVDILHLLSRIHYFDRNNYDRIRFEEHFDRVEFDDTFRSKYIFIFCFELPSIDDAYRFFPWSLIHTCSELYYMRDDFELVVVPKKIDSPTVFYKYVSIFPPSCLVVPFKDADLRNSLSDHLKLFHPCFNFLLVNVEKNIVYFGDPAIDHLQKLLPQQPMDIPTFCNRLVKSSWPVVREQVNYPPHECHVWRRFGVLNPEYPHDINEMVSESKKSCPIEIGQSFDVLSLLSCKGELNYLGRNNGGRVELNKETFKGKHIMVCCFHVPIFRVDLDSLYVQGLVSMCSDLYSKDDFEMVVVTKMNKLADYEPVFNHFMSGIPSSCLVVPFESSKGRDFICKYLNLEGCSTRCLILDDNGCVLHHGSLSFTIIYGAEVFPFTVEHRRKLDAKEIPLWQSPSTSNLEGLLQCHPSAYLERINSEGVLEMAPISEINQKLVGLYLCVNGQFIPTLHKVYQACITRQLPIEILLVYLSVEDCLDPKDYKVKIDTILQKQKIHWWCVPFNNSVSRRLRRLTLSEYDNTLIIVGPHGEFVDPYGGEIMSKYGADGYPFTREDLVLKELEKVRELTIESLLIYGSRDFLLRGSDSIAMGELQGKNILLYFAGLNNRKLCEKLFTWYPEMKARRTDFEVVFVRRYSSNTTEEEDDLFSIVRRDNSKITEEEFDSIVSEMPWLVCPFDFDHSASLEKKLFPKGMEYDTLVQFGQNGHVCSFGVEDRLTIHGPLAFPFEDDLRQYVISQFCDSFMEYM